MKMFTPKHIEVWSKTEAKSKNLVGDEVTFQLISECLTKASLTHFEAVACDIDGTLTRSDSVIPSRAVIAILRKLLRRGVRIVLITGRGTTAEDVLQQILATLGEDNLSERYLNRLHCLIDNGSSILEPGPGKKIRFQARELAIIKDLGELQVALDEHFKKSTIPALVRIRCRNARVRLEFSDREARDLARLELGDLSAREPDLFRDLNFASGAYRNSIFTIDLTPTTKGQALEALCRDLGIDPDKCLRIGDQATTGGNDFDLLDVSNGFTVGGAGPFPTTCHLVVDADGKVLQGVEGTEFILNMMNFSAPLAVSSRQKSALAKSLLAFERDVNETARRQLRRVAEDFAASAGYLYSDEPTISARETLATECYDSLSGAVRLANWETQGAHVTEPLGRLFNLSQFNFSARRPKSEWSMYSDTGILLRGPSYYPDWTREWYGREHPILRIIEEYLGFLGQALTGIANQADRRPSVTRMKLLLAVMDNAQDMLCKCLHLAFALHSEIDGGPEIDGMAGIATVMSQHTLIMVRLHTQNASPWDEIHTEYYTVLGGIYEAVDTFLSMLRDAEVEYVDASLKVPRSRECDHFLENIAGTQIGMEKHLEQHSALREDSFAVAGLVYGGIELPFIAQALGQLRGLEVIPGLIAASSYTRSSLSSDESREGLLEPMLNFWMSDFSAGRSAPVLLADDNMTTGRSLQRARDAMEDNGYSVLGAVVVRYPGMNRFVQMSEIDDSIPDPDVFMSYVRGLVAPAPYARLVERRFTGSQKYLDQTGVFNKSADRLKRHLEKHLGENLPGRG